MTSPIGKYVQIDTQNPEALAICQYSGLPCMHKDLVRQMEWRGDGLVWTGLLVNKRFADKPNPQGRSPILPPDPIPVDNARPQFIQSMTFSNNPLPLISLITYPIAALWNVESGALSAPQSQVVAANENYNWSLGGG